MTLLAVDVAARRHLAQFFLSCYLFFQDHPWTVENVECRSRGAVDEFWTVCETGARGPKSMGMGNIIELTDVCGQMHRICEKVLIFIT